MERYVEQENSLNSLQTDLFRELKLIADRYMLDNPYKDVVVRGTALNGLRQNREGHYILDFEQMYPNADIGDYAYAFTHAVVTKDKATRIFVKTNSPIWVYLNGELIFKTGNSHEASNKTTPVSVNLKKGINQFFIKCQKNVLGFGCEFGDSSARAYTVVNFLNPIKENLGKLGMAYTANYHEDIFHAVEDFPEVGACAGKLWLPVIGEQEISFSKGCGYLYYATFINSFIPDQKYSITETDANIYIDGKKVKSAEEVRLSRGCHYVVFEKTGENALDAKIWCEGTPIEPTLSCKIKAIQSKYLVMGPFEEAFEEITKEFNPLKLYQGQYWNPVLKNEAIRLCLEGENFGLWNYPTGVVLYGLGALGKLLGNYEICDYVKKHLSICIDGYDYTFWDTEKYGRAAINQQFIDLSALDYCGSCGNALLFNVDDAETTKLATMIADYIANKQERLETGMFYRNAKGTNQENTMWIDDLYMSVPFLCRYYEKTGEEKYLEDAINQYKCFKKLLYMDEKKLMSHVFALNYGKRNEIPWGRGNGWVIFAITELLRVIPKEHKERQWLIDFYTELCEGYWACQDENGMWHQILDDPESYIESSCTAMFICAYARGVRNGWLTDKKYVRAAYMGWEALTKYCIDKSGNIYGVCVGSGLSFRRDYYKKELPWCINDTHGTGIVLLAGVELLNLERII